MNLMVSHLVATKSTEKHGKNEHALELFPCPCVAMNKKVDTRLELSVSVVIKLKEY